MHISTARVAVVVPCFNEAERLQVTAYREFLRAATNVGFVFVNDASTDATRDVIERIQRLAPTRVIALANSKRMGKGETVRYGMSQALAESVDYVGFWDADLATPLDVVLKFSHVLDVNPTVNAVIGVRCGVRRQWNRRLLACLQIRIARRLLKSPHILDTQCGAKLFRANALLQAAIATPFCSKWMFDIELLDRLLVSEDPSVLRQIPLPMWTEVTGSKVTTVDICKSAFDLVKMSRHRIPDVNSFR